MSDICKKEGGFTGGELVSVLVDKIQGDAMNVTRGLNLDNLNALMDGKINDYMAKGKEEISNQAKEMLGDEMGGALGEEAGKALQNLFGN